MSVVSNRAFEVEASAATPPGALDARGEPGAAGAFGAGDLAELMVRFTEVSTRLQGTHEQLRAEVARLTRELTVAHEALERSRRAAALGEMAAGIAHEVRNPLASIRLYAALLEEDLREQSKPRETARKIRAAASGLERIVVDVLSFARGVRVHAEPVHAGSVIADVLEAVRRESPELFAGVLVQERRAVGDPRSVLLGEPGLVRQALANVVRNALQAMQDIAPGGRRMLTVGWSLRRMPGPRVRGVGGANAVALLVSDTGPGFAREALDRLFTPFFTTRAAGTGLGLAMVNRIVEAHAGSVRIKSWPRSAGPGTPDAAPVVGATVELLFPRAHPHSGATHDAALAPCTEAA